MTTKLLSIVNYFNNLLLYEAYFFLKNSIKTHITAIVNTTPDIANNVSDKVGLEFFILLAIIDITKSTTIATSLTRFTLFIILIIKYY